MYSPLVNMFWVSLVFLYWSLHDSVELRMEGVETFWLFEEILTRRDADGRIFPFTRVACCTSGLPSDFTHRNLGRVEAETEGFPFTTLDIISFGCLFMVL
jgi:hypothetical protein